MLMYLNGDFIPLEQANISVEDRGNTFADGVYEVIRYYKRRPFEMAAHMKRLERSANALRIPLPLTVDELVAIADEVVARNDLLDANLYLQVTRGVAVRNHLFPVDAKPTLFMIARPTRPISTEHQTAGVYCISLEDRRHKMCDVKSLSLLPNVLARQEAQEEGAFEAILVRDGIVTEGSSSNLFAVKNKRLLTHPEGPHILSGITRGVVLELAARLNIPVAEQPFTLAELKSADEAFLTGTTVEVLPVARIDDDEIGTGQAGPVTKDLAEAFAQRLQRPH